MVQLPPPAVQAGLIASFLTLALVAVGVIPAGYFAFLGENPAQTSLYLLIGLAIVHAFEALYARRLALKAGLPPALWMLATFAYGIFAIKELKKVAAEHY